MMIAGLGIDMIEVERVAAKIGREAGFREMAFSAKEIDYCEAKTDKFVHYAARWAAKEAFFKALGTGWLNGTVFHEVELGHDEAGKPVMELLGETGRIVEMLMRDRKMGHANEGIEKEAAKGGTGKEGKAQTARGTFRILVSLSHLKSIASAVVIIEM